MHHLLSCHCGTLKGYVELQKPVNRGVCYCQDCQAFAHFLGKADGVLDRHGGTDVVQTLPAYVHIEQGKEALACMRDPKPKPTGTASAVVPLLGLIARSRISGSYRKRAQALLYGKQDGVRDYGQWGTTASGLKNS